MNVAPPSREKFPSQTDHPTFAAFYNWLASRTPSFRLVEPLRRETAGQAYALVLEVGVGTGLNFPFYVAGQVERVEAVDPDAAMLVYADRNQTKASVPITLTQASAEALPFADQTFDSAVVTLVFCSVTDPMRGLQEVQRVLKPGGTLLLFEHVRAQGAMAARLQDALVPLTTRVCGNCHWNRDTLQTVKAAGFHITRLRELPGVMHPVIVVQATRVER
ncbi:MAG: class I SAM-dependent methyltransferase [Ktedonobacteraceae bacterium]|nr:class I SAM-dependent methyltransferase [Ktedonobacteraceae bacterium]